MRNTCMLATMRVIVFFFVALIAVSCKVTIEKPTQSEYYEKDEIHFDVEYNGTGTVNWKSEHTAPDGTVNTIGNSEFKLDINPIGKGYPWEFKKSNLPVGVHKITAYKNENSAEIVITILPFCENPQLDCSYLDDGACTVGICDDSQKECVSTHAVNGTSCDDTFSCTDNDRCSEGVCIGQNTCLGNGICTINGCQYSGECDTDNDCEYLDSNCHSAYCSSFSGTCATRLKEGVCYIDGYCFEEGMKKPEEPCQLCDSTTPNKWSSVSYLPCNDQDECTIGDTCIDGVCTPKSFLDCNDDNPCTTDACDVELGCVHRIDDGESCDVDSDLPCVLGTCHESQCVADVSDGYCLIDNQCIPEGQQSPNGCSLCNPNVFKYSWYWNSESEGQSCSSGNDAPSCGQYACSMGQCVMSISNNMCYIKGECIEDNQRTEDGCWECDVDKGQFNGTFIGGSSCYINAMRHVLIEPSDLASSPVAFSSDYFEYSTKVPSMTSYNSYAKTFFKMKTGRMAMATCEVKDQVVSVAVYTYPGLRELHREGLWYSQFMIPDRSYCNIDSLDVNGDGFEEVLIGGPKNSLNDLAGKITVLDIDEIRVRTISDHDVVVAGGFLDFDTAKYEGNMYFVARNSSGISLHAMGFNERGTFYISDSPAWIHKHPGNYISASFTGEGAVRIVKYIPSDYLNDVKTIISQHKVLDGEEIGQEIVVNNIQPSGAISCGEKIFFSLTEFNADYSYINYINTAHGNTLKSFGSTEFVVGSMNCFEEAENYRLPRELLLTGESKLEGRHEYNYTPDNHDYLYIGKNEIPVLMDDDLTHNDVEEIGLLVPEGEIRYISSPIYANYLVLYGGGTVIVTTPELELEQLTIHEGEFITNPGISVSVNSNIILKTASADISNAAINFTGDRKSVVAGIDGSEIRLGELQVNKKDSYRRVIVDDMISSFIVGKISAVNGIIEVSDNTSVEIINSSEVTKGNGTVIFRGPAFYAPSINFEGVNLYVLGNKNSELTRFDIMGPLTSQRTLNFTMQKCHTWTGKPLQ